MRSIVCIMPGRPQNPQPRSVRAERNSLHLNSDLNRLLVQTAYCSFRILGCICALAIFANAQTSPRARVAVLDFGDRVTGAGASERVRQALLDRTAAANGIVLIDRN